MTLAEKIWGSSIGAFIAYGKTAAAAALKPLLVSDNGDGTGTLVVSAASSALPTGAATSANQGDGYRDIGGPVRITHNSTSQSVAVPAAAKAFVCMAEGGVTRCEIGGAASATSTIYVAEEGSMSYPITGGSQTLFAYGTAGYGNFRFLG